MVSPQAAKIERLGDPARTTAAGRCVFLFQGYRLE
jgi:hypothetical protein